MTVYLEYAVLDNFTMDCLLLFCAAITLKVPYKFWRIALGGAVGTAIALAFVNVTGVLNYLFKALCLFLMCLVSVGWGKKLFWHILLTLAYTFVTGGAIVGIFNLLQVSYLTENGLCYNMPVPLFVYILGLSAVVFLCYSLAVFLSQTKKLAPHLKRVKLVLDKAYSLLGFCDSGNTAEHNGIPVCFVTKSFRGLADFFAQKTLSGQVVKVKVATLTGESLVSAVPAVVEVDGRRQKIWLALPPKKCQTQYELLLSGLFCSL